MQIYLDFIMYMYIQEFTSSTSKSREKFPKVLKNSEELIPFSSPK